MTRKNAFYRFYFGFVIVFAVIITVALCVLHSFLKTYESAQPKTVAQNMFDKYIKTANISELKEDYGLRLSDYETEQNAKKEMDKIISGKDLKLYYSSHIPKGSDVCFAVKAGNENIISIALSKNKKKGKFGITGYKVNNISLADSIYKSVNIEFPSDADVSVNGKPISEKDAEQLPLPQIKDVDLGDNPVYICNAKIDDLLSADIKITTGDKKGFAVLETENGFSVVPCFSESFTKEIYDFALEGSKVYAAHMQDDSSLAQVGKYVDTASDFYKNVRSTIVTFAWDHDGYDFENVSCSDLRKHSKEIYSCRVKFTHVLKLGAKRYRDSFDKRIYMRVTEKSKKIIDMQSVG